MNDQVREMVLAAKTESDYAKLDVYVSLALGLRPYMIKDGGRTGKIYFLRPERIDDGKGYYESSRVEVVSVERLREAEQVNWAHQKDSLMTLLIELRVSTEVYGGKDSTSGGDGVWVEIDHCSHGVLVTGPNALTNMSERIALGWAFVGAVALWGCLRGRLDGIVMPGDRVGYSLGEICNRGGCVGVLDLRPVENCSCHISAPCGACENSKLFCTVCGRESEDGE